MSTRLPRDLSGNDLIKLLRRNYGYEVTRQTGSHVRLTLVAGQEQYHLTIPKHRNLRVGTLNSILGDVSEQIGQTKQQIVDKLFG